MTEDRKVSQRYRELPREEPPRHVDDAILAASRRATQSRPAPLVVPAGRRRWYFPVAAAAIIVLAVAVTVHVERQRPDLEVAEEQVTAIPPPREEQPQAQAPAKAPMSKREAFTPDPKPASPQRKSAPRDDARLADLYKGTPAPPESSTPAAAPAPLPVDPQPRSRAEAQGTMGERRAATESIAAAAARTPEQWLQGIADLRRQGKHEDADRELAEFRKRYPDFQIPAATLEKIEKR